MRASVIIVNFNNKRDLERCLPSVIKSLSTRDEIIIVDNASTDGSAAWIEENYPQIYLVRSEANSGYAGGNNLGASSAEGEYLVFLNPDTVVDPLWLEKLIQGIEGCPEVGLVTSKILMLAEPGMINTCGSNVHISGITLCNGLNATGDSFQEESEVNAVSGAGFLIRKAFFQQLGGFDEDFFMYMEDTDLSWRARLAGKVCLLVPTSIIYHDYQLNFGPEKVFYQERNRYLMHLKSLEWKTMLILIPVYFLAELVTWGFVLLRDAENWRNKIRAYGWIRTHWEKIREKRASTQDSRKISDKTLLRGTKDKLDILQTGNHLLSQIAQALFNPAFRILRAMTFLVINW